MIATSFAIEIGFDCVGDAVVCRAEVISAEVDRSWDVVEGATVVLEATKVASF